MTAAPAASPSRTARGTTIRFVPGVGLVVVVGGKLADRLSGPSRDAARARASVTRRLAAVMRCPRHGYGEASGCRVVGLARDLAQATFRCGLATPPPPGLIALAAAVT